MLCVFWFVFCTKYYSIVVGFIR